MCIAVVERARLLDREQSSSYSAERLALGFEYDAFTFSQPTYILYLALLSYVDFT